MKNIKGLLIKGLWLLSVMVVLGSTNLVAQSYSVTFPTVSGTSGTTQTKAIVMNTNLTGQNVLSFGFKMKYDPNIVEVQSIDQNGTILQGKDILSNISNSTGVMTIGWLSTNPLSGTGDFLKITFLFKNAGTSVLGLKTGTTFDINTSIATVTLGSATTASKVITVGSSSDKKVGEFIDIPLTPSATLSLSDNIVGYDFTASYDATILQYVGIIKTGTLSASVLEPVVNALPLGSLNVAVISPSAITGTGNLIYVRMLALKKGAANFTLNTFEYNSGTPSSTFVNGTISVANSAPVITAPLITSQNVSEGSAITIPVSATDADGASDITYNAPTLPAGIPASAWNSATHTFSWTPGYNQSSLTAYPVIFSVTDGSSSTVSTTVNITVTNSNRPPSLTLNPTDLSYVKNEGETITIGLTGSDADVTIGDGDVLSFAVSPSTVANVTFTGTGNTRTFNWPIGSDQSGSYTFTFTVTDSHGETDSKVVNVTVNNVNSPPSFTVAGAAQMPNSTLVGGHQLAFNYKAIDPESDAITYSYTVTPSITGIVVNPTTGAFTWTPGVNATGTYQVVVYASDGVYTVASSIATVTITPNSKPSISAIPSKTGQEGSALNFTVSATDANSDPISYTYTVSPAITSNAPALDVVTGAFTWTPNYLQAGSYTFTFVASDGLESASVNASVVISDLNRAPVLASVAPQSINEMSLLSIQLSATDQDTDNTLTYSFTSVPAITGNLPAISTTGLFTWTPNYVQAGVYTLTFTVTDNKGATATQSTVVTVNNVNVAPTLSVTPAGAVSVGEGSLVTVQLNGADVNTGDVLTYSYTSTPSATGATLNSSTGAFSWTPAANQAGIYTLTFTVSDGSLSASVTKVITVVKVNIAPTLTLNPVGPNFSVSEGTALNIQLVGADANAGTTLTYSYTSTPAATGATINASTGAFSWTPATNQAGTYNVIFKVSDGSLTTEVSSIITVIKVNIAPTLVLNPAGPFSINEGAQLNIQLLGSDVNSGTTLTYSYTATPTPIGATFNTTTGSFAWKPATNQAGTYNVTFTVSDGSLSTSVTSVITVVSVNIAPTLTLNPAGPFTVNEGSQLNIQLVGADVNSGTTLTYLYNSSPAAIGATFNNTTGLFSWTPTFSQAGTYNVTFTVSDGGYSTNVNTVITVVDVNVAPVFTLPVSSALTIAESPTASNTVVFLAGGTEGISYSMIPNSPALSWASFDPATKTLTLTPSYGVASAAAGGIYAITIRATGANSLYTDFILTVTVTASFRSPEWTGTGTSTIATKSIRYNEVFNFSYVAKDPDGHVITYSLESITPSTASAAFTNNYGFGGFGQLVFTPTSENSGKVYTIVVKATCSEGLFSVTTTVLTVGVNTPPAFSAALTSQNVKVHNVPVAFIFQYVASDIDGDPFTYSLISGKGSLTTAGFYSWTPEANDKGTTNLVKVRISDSNNPLVYSESTAVLTVDNFITGVEDAEDVPATFVLMQNYPNPFNPSTTIQFGIPASANVKISVYNILGEEVAVLGNSMMAAGNHKIVFNASNLPSGLYMYRIQADNFTQVKKMLLTK